MGIATAVCGMTLVGFARYLLERFAFDKIAIPYCNTFGQFSPSKGWLATADFLIVMTRQTIAENR